VAQDADKALVKTWTAEPKNCKKHEFSTIEEKINMHMQEQHEVVRCEVRTKYDLKYEHVVDLT